MYADDLADDSSDDGSVVDQPGGSEAGLAPVTVSTINFVDLAGSERLSQASTDDAEKEKLRQKEVRLRGARMP